MVDITPLACAYNCVHESTIVNDGKKDLRAGNLHKGLGSIMTPTGVKSCFVRKQTANKLTEIITRDQYSMKVTSMHRQPVLRNGKLVELIADKVVAGDCLVIAGSRVLPGMRTSLEMLKFGKLPNLYGDIAGFSEVVRVNNCGIPDEDSHDTWYSVVDICEVEGGLFIANGIVTHNSNYRINN
jgi:intein/homing endonuclease